LLTPLLIRKTADDPGFSALVKAAFEAAGPIPTHFSFDQLDRLIEFPPSGAKSAGRSSSSSSFQEWMAQMDLRAELVEKEVAGRVRQESIPSVVFSAIKCETANRLLSGLTVRYIDARTPLELIELRDECRRLTSSLQTLRSQFFASDMSAISIRFTNSLAQWRSLGSESNNPIHDAIWQSAPRSPVVISPVDEDRLLEDSRMRLALKSVAGVKADEQMTNLLTQLLQYRSKQRELVGSALSTNRAFSILSGYRLNAAQWLLGRTVENAAINQFLAPTNRSVGQNRKVAHDLNIAFTPIVVREVLEDPDWAPLLAEAIRIQFTVANTNDPCILWCADALFRLPVEEAVLPEPWPEGVQTLLDKRIPLAESRITEITRDSGVREDIVRSIKMYRLREIMELTANYYQAYHQPNGLASLHQNIDRTFREIENKQRSLATINSK